MPRGSIRRETTVRKSSGCLIVVAFCGLVAGLGWVLA